MFSALEKDEVKVWFSMAHTGRHLETPQRAGSYSRGGRRRRWGNQERVVAQKEWSRAGCWILSKLFYCNLVSCSEHFSYTVYVHRLLPKHL